MCVSATLRANGVYTVLVSGGFTAFSAYVADALGFDEHQANTLVIENGKLTKTLRNPNYRGITIPFWHSLRMVGNEDTVEVLGTPFCGKGEPNQSIYVGHSTPICLFDNIEIFGGVQ